MAIYRGRRIAAQNALAFCVTELRPCRQGNEMRHRDLVRDLGPVDIGDQVQGAACLHQRPAIRRRRQLTHA